MSKIVLILMIKNESKIIRRCIDTVIDFVDAFCITDTGSTDNTLEIIDDIIKTSSKPGKRYSTTFDNFGFTRTESFTFTKEFVQELGWDLGTTFGLLLDADMVLMVEDNFNKDMIGEFDEYKILQTYCNVDYQNTRFVRMSLDWKCVGCTHEFWVANDNTKIGVLTTKKLWINDISDGGCKTDKYDRDIILLNLQLERAEKVQDVVLFSRALFYLGQTYMCKNEYQRGLEYYKKRLDC